jgi:hypothetical protein
MDSAIPSTVPLAQIVLVLSIIVPLISISYFILAIRLLLIHEGVKSPFSSLFPHQHIMDLQRILSGDKTGLSLEAAAKFDRLRAGLIRSFEFFGFWLIGIFIALHFFR